MDPTEQLDGFAVMRKNGDIFTVAVSPEDYERVLAAGPWSIHPRGFTHYAQRHVRKADGSRSIQMLHQFLVGHRIDHIDGNGLNNCRWNLRPATQAQNCQNKRLQKKSRSGFRGVSWNNESQRWRARITCDGKQRWLGSFTSKEEAGAITKAARMMHMPFSIEAFEAAKRTEPTRPR